MFFKGHIVGGVMRLPTMAEGLLINEIGYVRRMKLSAARAFCLGGFVGAGWSV